VWPHYQVKARSGLGAERNRQVEILRVDMNGGPVTSAAPLRGVIR
jgi:hypothetical protein